MTGRCGIPITAIALAVNVTVVSPPSNGYLVLHPGGTPRPFASTLNFRTGKTRANNAVVALGDAGDLAVGVVSASDVHVVIDVYGYFE